MQRLQLFLGLLVGKPSSFSVCAICSLPRRENVIYFTKLSLISYNINRHKITFSTYIHAAVRDICLRGFTLIALLLENIDNLKDRKNTLISAPWKSSCWFSSKKPKPNPDTTNKTANGAMNSLLLSQESNSKIKNSVDLGILS